MLKKLFFLSLTLVFFVACSSDPKTKEVETVTPPNEGLVPTINYDVLAKLPHGAESFTEGLLYYDNHLYESTGSPDNIPQVKSVVGIVDTVTGKINAKVDLGRKYFGEGIVILNDKLYQLTYKNQIGFVYDAKTYKQIQFGFCR